MKKDKDLCGYNDEPVYYCRSCLSLHILRDVNENDICGDCGAVNFVSMTSIDEWTKKNGNEKTDSEIRT